MPQPHRHGLDPRRCGDPAMSSAARRDSSGRHRRPGFRATTLDCEARGGRLFDAGVGPEPVAGRGEGRHRPGEIGPLVLQDLGEGGGQIRASRDRHRAQSGNRERQQSLPALGWSHPAVSGPAAASGSTMRSAVDGATSRCWARSVRLVAPASRTTSIRYCGTVTPLAAAIERADTATTDREQSSEVSGERNYGAPGPDHPTASRRRSHSGHGGALGVGDAWKLQRQCASVFADPWWHHPREHREDGYDGRHVDSSPHVDRTPRAEECPGPCVSEGQRHFCGARYQD